MSVKKIRQVCVRRTCTRNTETERKKENENEKLWYRSGKLRWELYESNQCLLSLQGKTLVILSI